MNSFLWHFVVIPASVLLAPIAILSLCRNVRQSLREQAAALRPMPVCVGDPEAPSEVFLALYHEFQRWESVAPDDCSVFVLVEDHAAYFHPEDVATARWLRAFNPDVRLVAFSRKEGKLRGVTLLDIEANVGVA